MGMGRGVEGRRGMVEETCGMEERHAGMGGWEEKEEEEEGEEEEERTPREKPVFA